MGRAELDDVRDLFGRSRIDHEIGGLVLDPGQGMAVLLAHGGRFDEPVAEGFGQRARQRC